MAIQALGTFITEWDEGAQECLQLLASEASARHAAQQLTAIAQFYRFEGWLINIENDVPLSLIPNLLLFLRYT